MNFFVVVTVIITILIAFAVIWWYYPSMRKTWGPGEHVQKRVREVCRESGIEYPPANPRIVISKAARTLDLFDGEKLLKTYKVALGTNPLEDKRKEGDGCTPEGDFYICTKNDRSRFRLFLGISYPNIEDADRGKRTNLINDSEYRAIEEAIKNRKRPPWNTRLGGEVGIHGGGAESDWTLGCIAMANEDIEELFMLVDPGTPVTIQSGYNNERLPSRE